METIRFVTSLLTFYMKGEITVEQNFVRLKDPNSILGLIPLGAKKESIAINQISSTQSNFKVKFGKLIVGIALAIIAFAMLGQDNGFLAFLILAVIATNTILNAFEVDLQINMTSGQTRLIDFFPESVKLRPVSHACAAILLAETKLSMKIAFSGKKVCKAPPSAPEGNRVAYSCRAYAAANRSQSC